MHFKPFYSFKFLWMLINTLGYTIAFSNLQVIKHIALNNTAGNWLRNCGTTNLYWNPSLMFSNRFLSLGGSTNILPISQFIRLIYTPQLKKLFSEMSYWVHFYIILW